MSTLKVRKLNKNAVAPERATDGAAKWIWVNGSTAF